MGNDLIKLPRNQYRISITSKCNMKCLYCHNEGNVIDSELTLREIRKLVENSYNIGLNYIRLTGGEPLIHPEIFEICKVLSKDYNLKVGINTNGIEIDKLIYMINQGWIDRVIVGIDYFDKKISKNSPVGISSKIILYNVLKIKAMNCDVSISMVYCNEYENVYKMLKWGIENKIRIKVIEIVTREKNEVYRNNYNAMKEKLVNDFNLETKLGINGEIDGYIAGFRCVSFFYSLCYEKKCNVCKNVNLRVMSNGMIKQCLFNKNGVIDIDDKKVREKIIDIYSYTK